MQPQHASLRLAAAFLTVCTLASAWPGWLPEANSLVVRQDTGAPAATATPTGTTRATGTSDSDKAGITPPPNGNSTRPANGNGTRPEFDPRDPAGGVAMITPGPLDGTQLYKVGDYVTWAWNYTSLQASPTAIDVLVSCSAASRTWTLTQNMTFATRADFVWDTKDNKGSPYLVQEYTLLIHDSDTAMTQRAEAGYLAPYSGFKFGVYTGQEYIPMASGWKCVSCSGAASTMDKRALGVALTTSVITVAAFTWFVAGAVF
ncbi:hypothetical protein GGTG_08222 [Gaeumannomyces tritici R3-111a-1]|uniref:DUF7137 domain-containing protein n=1 Tax=Gaeumannomyces tritici (strain R3-111a-1) TaxID=644352 RepID=J3P3Y7_GAET3|nr:hypothetical protein GGTG_08222 [Gaeumannomyces tritici R3-111a-1]EJT74381.1 hypothetical protein GGTG_08222 [Gaeumannomyces tritici R3-111a-1]